MKQAGSDGGLLTSLNTLGGQLPSDVPEFIK